MATIFVSASRSRRCLWRAKSGGHGEDLAIPAEQMAQTKIITPNVATIFVSASRSRRIAKSGGHGEDLAIPAEQMTQTKIITPNVGEGYSLAHVSIKKFELRSFYPLPPASSGVIMGEENTYQ